MAKAQKSNGQAKAGSGATTGQRQAMWDKFAGKAEKNWKKAREAKAGGGNFETPDIEDGTYTARCTKAVCAFSKGNKDNPPTPYVNFSFIVVGGEYAGTKLNRSDWLTGTNAQGEDNSEDRMSYLSRVLQGFGYDVSESSFKDIPGVIEEIASHRPYVEIATVTKQGSGKNSSKKYLTIYVNKPLTDEEAADLDIDDDDDPEEGSEVEEDSDVEEEAKTKTAKKKTAKKKAIKKVGRR